MRSVVDMSRVDRRLVLLAFLCGGAARLHAQAAGDLSASVKVDAGHIVRQIPSSLFGTNLEWVWNGYSLWDDQRKQPDPKLVGLAGDMGITLMRYPGGMYADFYHWQNGVGPYNSRPVVPFRTGDYQTGRILFGTDEALAFARQANGELMITVNAGTGTPEEAAAWVRYVNTQGLKVRYWEIGNEVYISDGSTAQNTITMDPATYAAKVLQFAKAMRAADRRIKIGAIGGQNRGYYAFVAYPDWNRVVLQAAGNAIDFLAVHNSYAPVNVSDSDDVPSVYAALLAAPLVIAANLQALTQEIATYAPARASQIAIAVTEWGPLFQSTPAGRYAQHTRTLGAAIFAADMLKTFFESPFTQIANFHVFNDMSIMCWVCSAGGSYPPVWNQTAEAMAFQLVRNHFGTQLVPSTVTAPTYDSPAIGMVPSVRSVPYLDVMSSLSADGQTLYVIAINKNPDSAIEAAVSLAGFVPDVTASAWMLNGTGIDANTGTEPLQVPGVYWAPQAEDPFNPQFHNGGPGQVTVTGATVAAANDFSYRFPAHSVTALQFQRAR